MFTKLIHFLLPAWFVLSNFQVTFAQPNVETEGSFSDKDVTPEVDESDRFAELKEMLDNDEDQIIIWVVQVISE